MKSLGGLCSVQAPLVQTNCAKSVRVWHTGSVQALQLDRKFFDEIDLTKPCHLWRPSYRGTSNISYIEQKKIRVKNAVFNI